jgi:SAM-dependent methyltransferase
VVGIDRDPRALRYAARRFGRDAGGRVELRVGDPAALADGAVLPQGAFGLVLALGLLPRLADPARALDAIRDRLEPGGVLIASLPPILDGQTLAMHQARPGEPSAMYLWDWESELGLRFKSLRLFRHLPPPGRPLDLADPAPSSLDPAAFRCEEIPRAEIYDVGSLTALFVCS